MAKLWDDLAKGIGNAVTDVREKAVEEAWYGRVVSDRDDAAPLWSEKEAQQPGDSFGSRTHEREVAPDMDIER